MGERSVLVRLLAMVLVASAVPAFPAQAAQSHPALAVLESLPVAAEATADYDRDLFRHWIRQPDGCDTRDDVLIAERTSGTVRGCAVVGGRWVSSYDGRTTTDPSRFDIDHMVPLKEAWESGAWRWDAATRQRYANDLGYAGALVAVTASANRSKADRDPAEWLPAQARCTYAKTWIGVKYRWRLSVDPAERRALTGVLRACPPLMRLPAIAQRAMS